MFLLEGRGFHAVERQKQLHMLEITIHVFAFGVCMADCFKSQNMLDLILHRKDMKKNQFSHQKLTNLPHSSVLCMCTRHRYASPVNRTQRFPPKPDV